MAAGDATEIVARGLRLARRDPTRTLDATQGLEHANDIHRALLTDGTPWTFLEATGQVTLTPGVSRYTLSSMAVALDIGIERIVSIINDTNGGLPLKGMHWTQQERLAYDTVGDPQGPPLTYAQVELGLSGATVIFWPTPDQAYSMGVIARKAVVDMAGADFPLIPAAHAGAVLTPYIAARMWEQQAGNDALAQASRHDDRHELARRRLIDAYGSARAEDFTFMEPGLYDYLEG